MTANTQIEQLHQLARLYGVQLGYYDIIARRPKRASPEALLAVLRALGAPVASLDDVPSGLRERQQAVWQRVAEPVAVAWEDQANALQLRLPAARAQGSLACQLQLETGEEQRWQSPLESLPALESAEIGSARYVVKSLPLPAKLPPGYHRLRIEMARNGGQAGVAAETLLISAPMEAYTAPEARGARPWGVFLPLYALRSSGSFGVGDFSDLEALLDWATGHGAAVVATLPLGASFLDVPFAPSPFTPASSLFWNELFLDLTRLPELERCAPARARLESADWRREFDRLQLMSLVDHRRAMALKRQVLEELARGFFAEPGGRGEAFQAFLKAHPQAEDYARFRAAVEQQQAPWTEWPAPARDAQLRPGDYDAQAERYHLYVQWAAHEQLKTVSEKAREKGAGLYLDLPLGVHGQSYDVWREREVFALEASGGAPPDDFFVKGQDWGLPPLHGEKLREQGYRYFIACLRHHMRMAGIIRLDHVMGLHRLFWIPRGLPVSEGVYVRKRAEELYAILTLESQRHKTMILGEDLGTVPRYVRLAMARHKLLRSYVLQFENTADPERALRPVPASSLAVINTHDTRPFAGFWQGLDIEDRVQLGLIDAGTAHWLRGERWARRHALVQYLERQGWLAQNESEVAAVLKACLAYLAASPARLVLVNLEDLWLETEQQNTPGTAEERPNWGRRARFALEAFCQLPPVLDTLKEVDRRRKQATSP